MKNYSNDVKNSIVTFSHDVKTPLSAIEMGTQALQDFLPILIEAYQRSKEAKLISNEIIPQHLEILYRVLDNLKASIDLIHAQVDTLKKHAL